MSIRHSLDQEKTCQNIRKDFERDVKMAQDVGVDVIFIHPMRKCIPKGYQTYVDVEEVTKIFAVYLVLFISAA